MKTTLSFLVLIFATSANAALSDANRAMNWQCSGLDTTNELPVSFNLVLADHDGSDYTYKSLDNFVYDGDSVGSVDLTVQTVICGKDDEGNDRIGQQYWDIQGNQFTFYSGCENESFEIEATCTPQ